MIPIHLSLMPASGMTREASVGTGLSALRGLARILSSLSHLHTCWWVFIEMRSWGVRQQSLDLIHIK